MGEKFAGSGRGTAAEKVPAVPQQHMRQQSDPSAMHQLEAVDRLEVICATEPNDCSDDLRVFDF